MSTETVLLVLPEIVLVAVATGLFVAGAFVRAREGWGLLAAVGLTLAAVALYGQQRLAESIATSGPILSGPLVIDQLAQMLRWMALGAGMVFVMMSARSAADSMPAEFMGCVLLIVAGMMLVAVAGELVLLFLALEMISIPTYVILYLARGDEAAQEATTKYFFLSILASALLLYGLSFLYGVCGSTQLADIYRVLSSTTGSSAHDVLAKIAVLLVVAGLGFRITIVPFHFYAPDVYQGTTNPNAGLLAVVPKVAGLTALVRVVAYAMPGMEKIGWVLALSLAVLTMTLGNVSALWQQNIRRMMAYSSIAHAGYMLIGLAVAFAVAGHASTWEEFDGVAATMFYLLVYAVATAGTFAALSYLSGPQREVSTLDDLGGLAKTHPKTAAAIALFMFSLAGLPPVAGFWGKLFLFMGALGVDVQGRGLGPWRPFLALAIIGVINAAISAAYYLRVIAAMYFRPPLVEPARGGSPAAAWATLVCAMLVIGLGAPDWVFQRVNVAARAGRSTFAHSPPAVASHRDAPSSLTRQAARPASSAALRRAQPERR